MTALRNLAQVIRSKNSGPFELTFDVMFPDLATYELVERSGVLTRQLVSKLYSVKSDDILVLMFFRPALAFKLTLRRSREQGSINETDTFGAQQHVPMMTIEIPT